MNDKRQFCVQGSRLRAATSEDQQEAYVYDVDVRFAVVTQVRSIDAVVLQPLNVRLEVADDATLEHRRLPGLDRRVLRRLGDDRLVRIDRWQTANLQTTSVSNPRRKPQLLKT